MGLEWQRRALTKPGNRAKIRIGKGNDAIGIKERTPKRCARSFGGSSCSKHKNKLRLITHCPFTGQAICKCSTRLHLLRPREKMIPAFAKAPPFSHKTMQGELQCDVYSISYVLLHKNRLLCLRRFLIIMRRTNISNFSFEQSFHPQSRGSTPQGYPFLNVQYLGTKMSS